MFNLIEQLPAEDKRKIEKYIELYGVKSGFVGVDKWLANWAKSKIKLYKLLGGQLIKKIPYQYEKDESELTRQINTLLNTSRFATMFTAWCKSVWDDRCEFLEIVNTYTFVNDKLRYTIKYKKQGASRELQLQAGMKPMRALGKILDYLKGDKDIDDMRDFYFEDFRLRHSQILNDKIVKGNMVISIHPLDFMTMSDNASNWQSCMSWTDQGCYHVGTVEMMNSNNVVCCYLDSREPYYFNVVNKTDEPDPACKWENKRWRQLFYVTKDIIVSGKPYPYINTDLSKELLTNLREMARVNLNWTYSFGPERYEDMIHINSERSMERARDYRMRAPRKHNIIFDTKGMYNDMLNDNNTTYWCVRNKVDKTKIISYSGKCNCLCCNNSVIERDYDSEYYYNERFSNVGQVVCYDCLRNKFTCELCDCQNPMKEYYSYLDEDGIIHHICKDCWDQKIKICPECGQPMSINDLFGKPKIYRIKHKDGNYNSDELTMRYAEWGYNTDSVETCEQKFADLQPIYMHISCALKHKGVIYHKAHNSWSWPSERMTYILPYTADREEYENALYSHLETVDFPKNGDDLPVVTKQIDVKEGDMETVKKTFKFFEIDRELNF